ncbi:uncharacterized protein LOC132563554 [Ylistrum balloti]|uniref:uncharacterized protein LOC132563554 n=1 Tax=Ylistrum balloti TaxID=509963 RepID=UPI002905A7EB|nr:uncharacterized protein LOC132563554 [Ylistrum balloti]
MSISRFSSLKVPELKEYLSRRGISVTGILKNKLVNLCEAVETLNLPVDPDCLSCKDDSTVTLDKIRSVGCPFDNPFTAPGYTSDFSNIPDFSLYDLFNYLINSKADYDKKKLKAYKSCDDYRLFIDGHIEELLFNELKSYPVCLFKAKCKPTQREVTYLNKKHYDLWILIEKEHSEVKAAYCTCTGGADGACRHVSAALYELENFEQKSVTDGENQWAKRPHLHDNPVPVKKLKVVKAK